MTDFGALLSLHRGWMHSFMYPRFPKEHVEKPSDVLKFGQEIEAKIVDFNEEEKKISLSMKALLAPEEDADADVADVDIDAVAKEEGVISDFDDCRVTDRLARWWKPISVYCIM